MRSSDKTAGLAARLRVRVELPLPPADVDTDEVLFLGLWGQAADWSGGMQQRFRVTRAYVEEMLDGCAPFCPSPLSLRPLPTVNSTGTVADFTTLSHVMLGAQGTTPNFSGCLRSPVTVLECGAANA